MEDVDYRTNISSIIALIIDIDTVIIVYIITLIIKNVNNIIIINN